MACLGEDLFVSLSHMTSHSALSSGLYMAYVRCEIIYKERVVVLRDEGTNFPGNTFSFLLFLTLYEVSTSIMSPNSPSSGSQHSALPGEEGKHEKFTWLHQPKENLIAWGPPANGVTQALPPSSFCQHIVPSRAMS